jgi:hypothetical protein
VKILKKQKKINFTAEEEKKEKNYYLNIHKILFATFNFFVHQQNYSFTFVRKFCLKVF